MTHPQSLPCTATVGCVLAPRVKSLHLSPLQAACYRRAGSISLQASAGFYFCRCGGTGEKMLATTVDGTMETSSFRGGHARARTEEIASSCYSGLALMHAPVSRQQETPVPCRKLSEKNILRRPTLHSSIRLSRHTPSVRGSLIPTPFDTITHAHDFDMVSVPCTYASARIKPSGPPPAPESHVFARVSHQP